MIPELAHGLVVDVHFLVELFAAHRDVFLVEAVREVLEVLELVAEALELDAELVEAFVGLLGAGLEEGVGLFLDLVVFGLELLLEVLDVLVVLLAL